MPCTETDSIFKCDDLTDIWDTVANINEGRIYTGFNTPTMQDLEHIEVGNIIMLGRDINKFCVEITENKPCNLELCGKVVVGDLDDQPFQIGDTICFFYRNVYSISEDLRNI